MADTLSGVTRIVLSNDTYEVWHEANPVLYKGELGWEGPAEDGSWKCKIGNGVDDWDTLGYSVDFQAIVAAMTAAALSATNAASSEQAAAESAAAALASKNAAGTSEANAGQSASAAAGNAASALASKNAASASETAAAGSASDALADKNAAAGSATSAAGSAANALASKNDAAISATGAAGSESNVSSMLLSVAFNVRYTIYTNQYLGNVSGILISASGTVSKVTDFIAVKSGDIYLYKGKATSSVASVVFYDTNKAFVSSQQFNSTSAYTEITVPADVVYAKFCSFEYTTNPTSVVFDLTRKNTGFMGMDKIQFDMVHNTGDENIDGIKTCLQNFFAPNLPYGTSVYGGSLVTDTNGISRNGFYSCHEDAIDIPSSRYWHILHINSNNANTYAYQRFVAYTDASLVYERIKVEGVWGDFVEVNAKDTTPTEGSTKPVTSDGVYQAIQELKHFTSMQDVQLAVRAGLIDQYLNVGDFFTVDVGGTDQLFQVAGIDYDYPVDPQFTHALRLLAYDCVLKLQSDAIEAIYYAETELPVGTYWFLNNYDSLYYSFTTTQVVPAGGQIVYKDATKTYIYTYPTQYSTTKIESVATTQHSSVPTEGTELTPVNYGQRCVNGSGNWIEEAIRQFLNSDAESDWWEPKTIYDRPPATYPTAGFMYTLDPDLLNCVGKVRLRTMLNPVNVGDGTGTQPGYSDNEELFFFISIFESGSVPAWFTGFPTEAPVDAEGNVRTEGLSLFGVDADRIKYYTSVANTWGLRTPATSGSNSGTIYVISASGVNGSVPASNSVGIVPCCCIV